MTKSLSFEIKLWLCYWFPIATFGIERYFNYIVHSLITGPWKLKSCSKLYFGLKSAAVKLLKQGSVILTLFFFSLTSTGNFLRDRDVILAPLFSPHLAGPAKKRERGHLSVTPEHGRRHAGFSTSCVTMRRKQTGCRNLFLSS